MRKKNRKTASRVSSSVILGCVRKQGAKVFKYKKKKKMQKGWQLPNT